MTDWRARALECEQQADDHPQDRPEALMEAAWAWGRAGEHQRGLALLAEAPLWEDAFDRGLARTARADLHAELGDHDAVRAEYALLWSERPDLSLCEAAGDHLEAYGDLPGALRWYDRGVAELTDEQRARLQGDDGWTAPAAYVVHARRRVRAALGMAADAVDALAPERLADGERPVQRAPRRREPAHLVQYWPRADLAPAQRAWPELFDEDLPSDYWGTVERTLRDAPPGVAVRLVPCRVAELSAWLARTGADVGEERTRQAYAEERVEAGDVQSWPPGRNDACWCGSGAKYKRCCLRA